MSEHWKSPGGGAHQVAIAASVYEKRQAEVDDFFGRPLSRRDHNVVHEGKTYAVYRFTEKADAVKFMRAFDGEPFDPRDMGSGKHWTRWYKGRTAKRKVNRNPYDFSSED